jgi:hypothetical protein
MLVTETPEDLAIDRRLQWGCILRHRLKRLRHDLGDFVVANLARGARTRLVIKPVAALFGEPPAPGPDRQPRYVELFRSRAVVQTFRRQ